MFEPYERPYVWTETGANAANLAAMVQDPADLAHGRSSEGSDGLEASAAVGRLRSGNIKKLIDTGTLAVGAGGGSNGGLGGGSSGGAGVSN
jgi:type IV pilus biogenesis protein CpaD/CtpE